MRTDHMYSTDEGAEGRQRQWKRALQQLLLQQEEKTHWVCKGHKCNFIGDREYFRLWSAKNPKDKPNGFQGHSMLVARECLCACASTLHKPVYLGVSGLGGSLRHTLLFGFESQVAAVAKMTSSGNNDANTKTCIDTQARMLICIYIRPQTHWSKMQPKLHTRSNTNMQTRTHTHINASIEDATRHLRARQRKHQHTHTEIYKHVCKHAQYTGTYVNTHTPTPRNALEEDATETAYAQQ